MTDSENVSQSKEFQKIKDRALRLLARRDHSRLELKLKLKQKLKIDNETFEALMAHLRSLGYMADEYELATRRVNEWRSQGRGRQWISGKLKLKGLPQVSLRDDLAEFESARAYLLKKLGGGNLKQMDQGNRTRIARSLISRGFSISLVTALLKGKNHADDSGNFQFEL